MKDVSISSSLEDGDVYLSFSSVFKIGAVSMTSIQLPIVDPRDSSVKYGEISFRPTLEPGQNELRSSTFLLLQRFKEDMELYRENLPISGFGATDVIELKIDKINSKLYLALEKPYPFRFCSCY